MIRKTFTVEGPIQVEVSAASGSITVERGSHGSVEVEVDTRNPDAWRVAQTGSTISVTNERGFGRGGRARIRIAVPDGTSLSVRTASANVRATAPLDRATLSTASGDIDLVDAVNANLKSASGDIAVDRIAADLTARAASGNVRVGHIGGRASLTSVSGDLQIDRVDGDAVVSTASGDVRVKTFSGSDFESATVSGDLELGLPPGRTVRLSARTLSGSVRLPDRRQASGSNGPEVSLRLRSVSGDIRIERVG